MKSIHVNLKPIQIEGHIAELFVKIRMEAPQLNEGDSICSRFSMVVGKKFLDIVQEFTFSDTNGSLSVSTSSADMDKTSLVAYTAERQTVGDVEFSYKLRLEPCGKNPAFDLGYEAYGMNGAGMTCMPFFDEHEQYHYILSWDLSALPTGNRGIWSFGEGNIEIIEDGTALVQSFYYAGDICGERKDGCGFYWLRNDELPAQETADFVSALYGRMHTFFEDNGEVYTVFARKVPLALTGRNGIGGVALKRSFLYLYPQEKVPDSHTLKFLFPHEMVHNWPKLNDEPFGTCTWYVEGTAEYYSMILTDRLGLCSREELLESLNKKARDYYENPRREVTNEWAGQHLFIDPEATLVPYGRGFFFLLWVDEQIRNATGSKSCLDQVVLALLRRTNAGEACGNADFLAEVKKISGLDLSEPFHQMENGAVILPHLSSFQTPITVTTVEGTERETGDPCTLYQFS